MELVHDHDGYIHSNQKTAEERRPPAEPVLELRILHETREQDAKEGNHLYDCLIEELDSSPPALLKWPHSTQEDGAHSVQVDLSKDAQQGIVWIGVGQSNQEEKCSSYDENKEVGPLLSGSSSEMLNKRFPSRSGPPVFPDHPL